MRGATPLIMAVALLVASPALAADPAGEWIGTLRTPTETLQLGLDVRRDAAGRLEARYDDITQHYRGLPMRRVAPGDRPAFEIKSQVGTMTYAWDEPRGRWTGLWRERGGAYRFALARGAIPPPTGVSPIDRIALGAFAVVMLLEAAAIARLLQLRRRRRLRPRPR